MCYTFFNRGVERSVWEGCMIQTGSPDWLVSVSFCLCVYSRRAEQSIWKEGSTRGTYLIIDWFIEYTWYLFDYLLIHWVHVVPIWLFIDSLSTHGTYLIIDWFIEYTWYLFDYWLIHWVTCVCIRGTEHKDRSTHHVLYWLTHSLIDFWLQQRRGVVCLKRKTCKWFLPLMENTPQRRWEAIGVGEGGVCVCFCVCVFVCVCVCVCVFVCVCVLIDFDVISTTSKMGDMKAFPGPEIELSNKILPVGRDWSSWWAGYAAHNKSEACALHLHQTLLNAGLASEKAPAQEGVGM